ncbi:hypothetical protein ACFSQP_01065 [Bizionia sediminis]|uniref:Uncharacterized protein n=1 Tax=Bizionia sediminis TaxID=1737064 RepID=A0ABW5KPW8_9FLAO
MDFDFIADVNQYIKSLNYYKEALNVKLIAELAQKKQRNKRSDYLGFSYFKNEQKIRLEMNNTIDLRLYDSLLLNNLEFQNYKF